MRKEKEKDEQCMGMHEHVTWAKISSTNRAKTHSKLQDSNITSHTNLENHENTHKHQWNTIHGNIRVKQHNPEPKQAKIHKTPKIWKPRS